MSSTQEVGEIFGAGSGPAHAMLRSPTVLIASVGLWGMNIFCFRLFGIDYVKVLKHDLIQIDGEEAHKDGTSSGSSSPVNVANSKEPIKYRRSESLPETAATSSTTITTGDSMDEDDENDYSETYDYEDFVVDPNAITWQRLVGLSMSLLFILHFTYYIWIDIARGGSIGAVFAFYFAVGVAIGFPLPSTKWLRKATSLTFSRLLELVYPRCACFYKDTSPRPIPFVDVFVADAMCSLSKVFFDMGMLGHMALHFPDPVPPSAHNILIPSAFAAVPYLIRARQCLIMYTVGRINNDPKRFSHLWNALKYSTSIFPLCLSAYQKTIRPKQALGLEVYLIILLAINALYALYWDIVMDWGMMQNPSAASAVCVGGVYPLDQPRSCGHALLRPRLRFGVWMSTVILVVDAVLRFSWVLRFYHKLFPSGDSFVLCTQFLEVFRRAIWNLLRVEWENLKQLKAPPLATPGVTSKSVDEEMTNFLPNKAVPKDIHRKKATA